MMLWLTVQFLVAGLVLSDSSPPPEDCNTLVTPLSLNDLSVLDGKWYFIEGFTDHEAFKSMLKVVDSSWLKTVSTSNDPKMVQFSEGNKFNGTCSELKINATMEHDVMTATAGTIVSVFQALPSCHECLVFNMNTTGTGFNKMLKMFGVETTIGGEEIHGHSFNLMAKDKSVKEEDLQHFRKQAACVGFSGEADYHYDSNKEFCADGEGQQVTL